MTTRNRMASEAAIRKHWAQQYKRFGHYDSPAEALEAGVCMACGVSEKCERAHIVALADGGANDASNLHMLCRCCHKASEGMSGEQYWDWIFHRTVADMLIQRAAIAGINVWRVLQSEVIKTSK